MIASCKNCQKIIKIKPSILNKNGNFCSRTCSNRFHLKNIPSEIHPKWKGGMIAIICKHCNDSFSTFPANKNKSKFCSRLCKASHQTSGFISFQCKYCKKIFQKKANMIRTGRASSKFCNTTCSNKSISLKKNKNCTQCGKEYLVKRKKFVQSKFCSYSCKGIWNVSHQKHSMTNIETIIYRELIKMNINFNFQHPLINKFVVDFYIPNSELVIQTDGTYWHSLPRAIARDLRCNLELSEKGYKVLRLSEKDIVKNLNDCIQKIYNVIHN